jgi:hypothetical protein
MKPNSNIFKFGKRPIKKTWKNWEPGLLLKPESIIVRNLLTSLDLSGKDLKTYLSSKNLTSRRLKDYWFKPYTTINSVLLATNFSTILDKNEFLSHLHIEEACVAILASLGINEDLSRKSVIYAMFFYLHFENYDKAFVVSDPKPKQFYYFCSTLNNFLTIRSLCCLLVKSPEVLILLIQEHVIFLFKIIDLNLSLKLKKKNIDMLLRNNPSLLLLRKIDLLNILSVFERQELPKNLWPKLFANVKAGLLIKTESYEPCIQILREIGTKPSALSRALTQILNSDAKTFKNKFKLINKINTIDYPKFCDYYDPVMLEVFSKYSDTGMLKKETIVSITILLQKIGINDIDIIKIFHKFPRLALCRSCLHLEEKLWYILKVLRLPFSMLLSNPVILSYSLKRIKSRLEYVRINAPYLIKHYTLSYWIQPCDQVFVEVRLRHGKLHDYIKFEEKTTSINI